MDDVAKAVSCWSKS